MDIHNAGPNRSHFEASEWAAAADRAEDLADEPSGRTEKRERVVRDLEYSHYPRRQRQQRRLAALTRDESASGLGVVMEQPEPVGALLQIALHTVDGEVSLEALARVVWCRPRSGGRYGVGLSLIEHSGPAREPVGNPSEASGHSERLSALNS